jgi:hypothetical protein
VDTTLTSGTTAAPTISSARRRSLVAGAIITAIAIAGTQWAVLKSGTSDSSEMSSLPYVAGAAFIVGVVLFAWLVPARIAVLGSGLPFAIVSVPLVAVFWSALSLLVAAAGILVALAHRAGGGPKSGRALAAIIVSSIVAVATVAAILLG